MPATLLSANALSLAWESQAPVSDYEFEPVLLAESASRLKASRIMEDVPGAWMVEKRRGDRLRFFVYVGGLREDAWQTEYTA